MLFQNVKTIDASLEVVWNITLDLENWPRWTPTVTRISRIDEGPFTTGSTARIKQPGLPEAEWRVTEMQDGRSFTWETNVRGMHMVATHELAAVGSQTESTLHLRIEGLVISLFWPIIRRSVRRSLEQENSGLKQACEAVQSIGNE